MLRVSLRRQPSLPNTCLQRVGKIFGKQIFDVLADCFVATKIENVFERGIQPRDAAFEINRQQPTLIDSIIDSLNSFSSFNSAARSCCSW